MCPGCGTSVAILAPLEAQAPPTITAPSYAPPLVESPPTVATTFTPQPSSQRHGASRRPRNTLTQEVVRSVIGGVIGIGLALLLIPHLRQRLAQEPVQPAKKIRIVQQQRKVATPTPVITQANMGHDAEPEPSHEMQMPPLELMPVGNVRSAERITTEQSTPKRNSLDSLAVTLSNAVDAHDRLEAAQAMRQIGTDAHPAILVLITALKDASPAVRREVTSIIGDLQQEGREALPALERAISSDDDEEVKTQAAIALLKIDSESEETIRVFRPLLSGKDYVKQLLACVAITEHTKQTPKWAERQIREAMKDSALEIGDRIKLFEACAESLGKLSEADRQTMAALRKFAEADLSGNVPREAHRAKVAADSALRQLSRPASSIGHPGVDSGAAGDGTALPLESEPSREPSP